MDEDRIGLVLARTSELKSKITNCIHKAPSFVDKQSENEDSEANLDAENQQNDDDDNDEDEAETESLVSIRDALESLEAQLSSLQALQQQQWYEKEAALSEIGYSQKKLLKELKLYKGKDLEVIREAIAFAGETEDNSDLLLPPYPTWPSRKFINGSITGSPKDLHRVSHNFHESERSQIGSVSKSRFRGIRVLLGTAAKAALTIVGVVAILNLAGLEPRIRKRGSQFKIQDLFHLQGNDDKRGFNECPPGKVLVTENGETRCVVKERVEVPFEPVVKLPDVNYGCG